MATRQSFFVVVGVSLVSFVLGFVVGKQTSVPGIASPEEQVIATTSWREEEDISDERPS